MGNLLLIDIPCGTPQEFYKDSQKEKVKNAKLEKKESIANTMQVT